MPGKAENRTLLNSEYFTNGGIVRIAHLPDYMEMIAFLAVVAQDAACTAQTARSEEFSRPPGRPPISITPFFRFVNQLLDSVAESRGHLTFTKADAGRGTLLSALKILSKYLPPGVMPNVLPISRLDRILSHRRAFSKFSRTLRPLRPCDASVAMHAIRQQIEIGIAAQRAGANQFRAESTTPKTMFVG